MTALDDALTILDFQIDFQIKLITFIILITYTGFIWFSASRLQNDSMWKILFKFFSKIFVWPTVFFLPLFTIMLFRDYAAISMWTLLISFYSIVFILTALICILFGWSKILEMFGIEVDLGLISSEKLNKGEHL